MRVHRDLLLAVLALLSAVFVTGGVLAEDEIVKELPFESGQIIKLDLNEGGSVYAEGWDKSTIRITWYDAHGDVGDHKVEIEECRGGYEINASWVKNRSRQTNSLHFKIQLPTKCEIDFRSIGGGLELVELDGKFTGRTAGGSITITGCKGEARLTSGGGSIEVTDSEMDGKITIGGGPVLLENIIGDLDAISGGGNVQYRNVRDRDGHSRGPGGRSAEDYDAETVLIFSAGGGINIDEAPEGANVTTGGGDINIENAAKFVHATTGGGDIEIEVNGGTVTAATGAGDITVTITGESDKKGKGIRLASGYGDISLVVPKGFSMDLDLTIAYTRNSSREFNFVSEYDIDEERTRKWDSSEGSPKKFIYGTGEFNGGKIPIEIRTTNGNIYIKEK